VTGGLSQVGRRYRSCIKGEAKNGDKRYNMGPGRAKARGRKRLKKIVNDGENEVKSDLHRLSQEGAAVFLNLNHVTIQPGTEQCKYLTRGSTDPKCLFIGLTTRGGNACGEKRQTDVALKRGGG